MFGSGKKRYLSGPTRNPSGSPYLLLRRSPWPSCRHRRRRHIHTSSASFPDLLNNFHLLWTFLSIYLCCFSLHQARVSPLYQLFGCRPTTMAVFLPVPATLLPLAVLSPSLHLLWRGVVGESSKGHSMRRSSVWDFFFCFFLFSLLCFSVVERTGASCNFVIPQRQCAFFFSVNADASFVEMLVWEFLLSCNLPDWLTIFHSIVYGRKEIGVHRLKQQELLPSMALPSLHINL